MEEDKLTRAEGLIAKGELDEAQKLIFSVKEKSGRKFFVQSKLYNAKGWYNEQRKQLNKAISADPENEEYKAELKELDELCQSDEYKLFLQEEKKQKRQMGGSDDMAECCCLCSCEACATGICESCDGC